MKDLRFVDLFGHCAILVITKFVQLSVIHPCSFKLVNQRYPLWAQSLCRKEIFDEFGQYVINFT